MWCSARFALGSKTLSGLGAFSVFLALRCSFTQFVNCAARAAKNMKNPSSPAGFGGLWLEVWTKKRRPEGRRRGAWSAFLEEEEAEKGA